MTKTKKNISESKEPMVSRAGVLDMQVCVPEDWTDKQVKEFAEKENPSGVRGGWSVRKQGSKFLAGANERVPCEERCGYVHIMLDA